MLDDLIAKKLLARDGDQYRLVPEAQSYLLPDKPTYIGDITHFFSPGQNTRLFRKGYDALAQRGSLLINAIRREYPDPTTPGPRFIAGFRGRGNV
ncbi:MAG: hypothetical protein ABSG98_00660 [Anaerolineales bacterium]|jgi:hypothetical protein